MTTQGWRICQWAERKHVLDATCTSPLTETLPRNLNGMAVHCKNPKNWNLYQPQVVIHIMSTTDRHDNPVCSTRLKSSAHVFLSKPDPDPKPRPASKTWGKHQVRTGVSSNKMENESNATMLPLAPAMRPLWVAHKMLDCCWQLWQTACGCSVNTPQPQEVASGTHANQVASSQSN